MILVDTSVWVDFLRKGDPDLRALLENNEVLIHPMVIGELACEHLKDRSLIADLELLQPVTVARHEEAMALLDNHQLWGQGLGYVDLHLLASIRLTQGATLWTRDEALRRAAAALGQSRQSESPIAIGHRGHYHLLSQ